MNDQQGMRLALAEAWRGVGSTAPNPCVGAVIVVDDQVVGAGCTAPGGQPHAEVMALQAARSAGHDVTGGTMYVTLEPCCHYGRTPPCSLAIIEAGIGTVVVGCIDPFPEMQGKSVAMLREAGLTVRTGVEEQACREVLRGFLRVMEGGLPEVTLKAATSLDGHIATSSGESKWITSEEARHHGHNLRAQHDALLVGVSTVLADDPRLTCRTQVDRDPVPVVFDTHLRTPDEAHIFRGPVRPVILCGPGAPERDLPADIVRVALDERGRVDVVQALRELGRRGLHRVMVEGGAQIHRSMLDAGVVDSLFLYMAPKIIAGGRSWVGGDPLQVLSDAPGLAVQSCERIGPDVLIQLSRPT